VVGLSFESCDTDVRRGDSEPGRCCMSAPCDKFNERAVIARHDDARVSGVKKVALGVGVDAQ
jgi:hypothetical protein